MSRASHSVTEIARYPETSPTNAKTSMLDHSVSRNSSALGTAFNNLINICAILILITILVFLELHIRRSILHSDPAVMRNTNDAVPDNSLRIHAQSNAVEL
jgi:hypothetical protein